MIEAVVSARALTTNILAEALRGINGQSEGEIRDRILHLLASHKELYPQGWYDPPLGGTGILFAEKPYERLKFETLRDPTYCPSADVRFTPESVGMVYASSVDRATGMIGDAGLTIYTGKDNAVREHIHSCLSVMRAVADHAAVGMKFSDLYAYAMRHFKESGSLVVGWMTTHHDPQKVNLGHTIPGSFGAALPAGGSFESLKEAIRTQRIYINEVESFEIPPTCAFTFEARLVDEARRMPNAFFHLTVTFSEGEKRILDDFDAIFRVTGMDYML